MQDHDKVKIL